MPVVEIANCWDDVRRSLGDSTYPDIAYLEANGRNVIDGLFFAAHTMTTLWSDIVTVMEPLNVQMFGRYEIGHARRYLGVRFSPSCDREMFYIKMRFGHLLHQNE